MPKIKTRETHRDIKVLDKASVAGERMKNAFIRSKETVKNLADDGQITPEEYAEDRVQYAAEDIAHDAGHAAANQGKKMVEHGRDAIRKHRDRPREPGQIHQSDAPQASAHEAARQNSIHQVEMREVPPQQHFSPVEQPVTWDEPLAREIPNRFTPTPNPIQSTVQDTPSKVMEPNSPSVYDARPILAEPGIETRTEPVHWIKARTGYAQSTYQTVAPSPGETRYRMQQFLQGQSRSSPVSDNRVVVSTEEPLTASEKLNPTLLGQDVRPAVLNQPAEAVEVNEQIPFIYSDHSYVRPAHTGKTIKANDSLRDAKSSPDVKQLTPTERGRQFAIKQAEKRAETVRAAQNRLEPIMEDVSMGCTPVEVESAPQPVPSRGEPSKTFSPVTEANQDVIKQKKSKTALDNSLQKAERNTELARAPSNSVFYTDRASSRPVNVERRGQKSRNLGNTAAHAEKRQTKGSIKTVEKAEKTIKQSTRSTQKASIKTTRKTAKTSQKAVKTAEQTSKTAIKTAQATAKATQKSAQVAAKTAQKAAAAARQTARASAVAAKAVAKAVAAAVKAIVAGVKELVAAIAAGGWVAVIAIVIICLIGVIIASPFGIFFSGNNRDEGAVTASAAVAQVMYDFNSKLEDLQDGDYDDITISGSLANWPEVLAVFAVKVAGNNDVDAMDVATLDQKRIKKLKDVFWDMNAISSEVETIDYPDSDPEDDVDDSWSESVLHITITSKTAEEMKKQYHFSEKQKKMLDELLESRDALLELIGDLQFISTDAYELLKHLPDDLPEERRKVIKTACSLVGKVNYFWGGKSLVIGWDSRWGSIQKVWADGSPTTGTYRPYGLDCSGFVDWVFYNVSEGAYVIGHGGGAADQHAYCRNIPWDEAMPGDLVFYPEDTHVGIVGGWDEDGNLLIIHCSAGVQITGASGFMSIARPVYYSE